MAFETIIGNDTVKKHLMTMMAKGTVANALLFAGQQGISLHPECMPQKLRATPP